MGEICTSRSEGNPTSVSICFSSVQSWTDERNPCLPTLMRISLSSTDLEFILRVRCEWQAYYLHFPCCCGQLCSLESLFLLMIVLPATTACSLPPFVLLSYCSFRLSFYQFLTSLDEKERDNMAAVCSRLGCAVVYCVITDPSKKMKWEFRMIAITQCSLLPKRNEHFFWLLSQSCTRSPGQTVMRGS